LTRTTVLAAVSYTPLDLLQLQLEKLAVNSILNPLTALLDARNGTVLANFHLLRTARMLLAETSLVMRSLPELRHLPNIQSRFSASRLESLYLAVAQKTAGNVSSMLADVRAGRRTEVQYINGYIVKRGEELGIKCVVNYSFMQMVMGKRMMVGREQRDDVPVLGKQKGLNPDA
jgi:2-dehydropantoate 2-reductase